jgi:hypothetical protein
MLWNLLNVIRPVSARTTTALTPKKSMLIYAAHWGQQFDLGLGQWETEGAAWDSTQAITTTLE